MPLILDSSSHSYLFSANQKRKCTLNATHYNYADNQQELERSFSVYVKVQTVNKSQRCSLKLVT